MPIQPIKTTINVNNFFISLFIFKVNNNVSKCLFIFHLQMTQITRILYLPFTKYKVQNRKLLNCK